MQNSDLPLSSLQSGATQLQNSLTPWEQKQTFLGGWCQITALQKPPPSSCSAGTRMVQMLRRQLHQHCQARKQAPHITSTGLSQQGRLSLATRKKLFIRGWSDSPGQWSKHSTLDNTVKHIVWILGGFMWSQDLDLVVFVGPSQLIILYDSVIQVLEACRQAI